jgi:hypothetical protein
MVPLNYTVYSPEEITLHGPLREKRKHSVVSTTTFSTWRLVRATTIIMSRDQVAIDEV